VLLALVSARVARCVGQGQMVLHALVTRETAWAMVPICCLKGAGAPLARPSS
jgi:hypothetical protein